MVTLDDINKAYYEKYGSSTTEWSGQQNASTQSNAQNTYTASTSVPTGLTQEEYNRLSSAFTRGASRGLFKGVLYTILLIIVVIIRKVVSKKNKTSKTKSSEYETSSIVNKRICSNCGKEINNDSQYCNYCGAQQTFTKNEDRKKVCISCGTVNDAGSIYCKNCGKNLEYKKYF